MEKTDIIFNEVIKINHITITNQNPAPTDRLQVENMDIPTRNEFD